MSSVKFLKFGSQSIAKVGSNVVGYINPIIKLSPWSWYNNDTTTMTIGESNRVSEWRDSSGNNRHLIQTNGSNQPLYVTNLIGNQGGVNFDGVTTFKFLSTTFTSNLLGVADVFFVGRMITAPGIYPYYFGGTTDNRRIIQYWYNNEMRLVTTDPSGTAFPKVKTQTIPTGFIYMNPLFDGTNSEYRENGNLISSNIPLRSCVVDGFRLGAGHGVTPVDTQSRLNGDILEFVIFNYKLNPTQRSLINNYFLLKYGL